ncbi:MAG: hypothetical protein GY940_13045 [bacterium]|nr:hypothetical protein [bacterium]
MSETYFDLNSNEPSTDTMGYPTEYPTAGPQDEPIIGFPIDTETIVSSEDALKAIRKALRQVEGCREGRLHLFKTIVGPLVPGEIRDRIEKQGLNDFSVAYKTLINTLGSATGALTLFGLDEKIESVKSNQRLIIIPFLELCFNEKIKELEKRKPFGWKIARKFFQKNADALTIVVNNMIDLAALAWTFCPGIGEPEPDTGFYNRFIFTGNGGFVDMGHFFNCAIFAYLYGKKEAKRRGEETEIEQRAIRENKWLIRLKKRNMFNLFTSAFWGFATSADTIEDRASDYFGLLLGDYMRQCGDNGKIIDYFVNLFPKLVYGHVKSMGKRKSTVGEFIDSVFIAFKLLRRVVGKGKRVDIYQKMKTFYNEYDAIDPKDGDVMPRGLIESIVRFYEEKYNGDEWKKYGSREWVVVIPQELWERVVRGREKFAEKALPIKIQLMDSGKLVEPYPGEPPM